MDFDSSTSPEQVKPIQLPTRILPIKDGSTDKFGDDDYSMRDKPQEEREQYAKVLEGARAVGENRTRFWNMLVATIGRVGYEPPQDRQTQVLDLGCGRCEEGIVLSAFFGGNNFGYASDRVKLTGVDISQKDIDRAIQDNQKADFTKPITTYNLPPNFEFIVGDATDLSKYPQVPQQADAVVIRQKQISDNTQVWTKIFRQALDRVTPEGIVLITSFSDIEHKMALEALQQLPCDVVITQANPHAKPLSHKEISTDRNIAIVKRKVADTTHK